MQVYEKVKSFGTKTFYKTTNAFFAFTNEKRIFWKMFNLILEY